MISNDCRNNKITIFGEKDEIAFELLLIVNALKHQANIPDKDILEWVNAGLTDKVLLKGAKGVAGEFDTEILKGVLEQMKKENEEKEKNQKENE